jgi:hypothetical protein
MSCPPEAREQLMKSANLLTIGMWILPVCLQLFIVMVMVWRGMVRQFGYFFAYCLLTPTRDLTLLLLQNRANVYAWIYWAGEGGLIMLQLAVVCEAFWRLVPLPTGLRLMVMQILKAAVALSAVIAFVLFAIEVRTGGKSIEAILVLERCARVVQVTMLLVAMMLVSRWGLAWRNYATGIFLGSGIAGLQLVPAELRGGLHLISDSIFVWLKPLIYNCAVIAWAIYFILPEKVNSGKRGLPQGDLTQWDGALKGYLYRQ